MIIKHIMHSRERRFSYCHRNIRDEEHELKQKNKKIKKKRKKRKAKMGVRRGSVPSFCFS